MASPLRSTGLATNARDTMTRSAKSPAKPSPRKVLGDLSPNKQISSPRGKQARSGHNGKTPNASPLKSQNNTLSGLSPARAQLGTSLTASANKRSFDMMQGATGQDQLQQRAAKQAHRDSPSITDFNAPSAHVSMSTSHDEESTDEDLEQLVANPSLSLPDGPPVASQGASQGGGSFSSLIDYDPAEATDATVSASVSPAVMRPERKAELQIPVVSRPPTRAETIRLRLKMAAYRVSTDQVYVPIGELRVPRYLPTLRSPSMVDLTQSFTGDKESTGKPTSGSKKTLSAVPRLLPAPTLEASSKAPTSHKISYNISPDLSRQSKSPDKKGLSATPAGSRRIHEMFMVSTDLPAMGSFGSKPKSRIAKT